MKTKQPLLQVENVKKRFCRSLKRSLWYGITDIASDLLARSSDELHLRQDEFLAVNDVSFDVHEGESVALIGRNGAGKSTLLKMINGLFRPDAGTISINGRVSALIELGAGFNPILSGRENIYVNASVLGMRKREVDRQLEEIVDFAELEEFIDTPLKNYSSGMKVRLGFAVASQLKPDLLLIDEVLAVGDAAFRAKCHRRLSGLLSEGTAIILVSHSNHTLLATCTKGVVLDRGMMVTNDSISPALDAYEKITREHSPHIQKQIRSTSENQTTGLEILDVFFRDANGNRIKEPKTGQAAALCLQVSVDQQLSDIGMAVVIRESSNNGLTLLALTSAQDGVWHSLESGIQELHLYFDALPFRPGMYIAKISVSRAPMHTLDRVDNFQFGVDSGLLVGDSAFYCQRSWRLEMPRQDDCSITSNP